MYGTTHSTNPIAAFRRSIDDCIRRSMETPRRQWCRSLFAQCSTWVRQRTELAMRPGYSWHTGFRTNTMC